MRNAWPSVCPFIRLAVRFPCQNYNRNRRRYIDIEIALYDSQCVYTLAGPRYETHQRRSFRMQSCNVPSQSATHAKLNCVAS